jgi:predicted metal-dependent hydrolase
LPSGCGQDQGAVVTIVVRHVGAIVTFIAVRSIDHENVVVSLPISVTSHRSTAVTNTADVQLPLPFGRGLIVQDPARSNADTPTLGCRPAVVFVRHPRARRYVIRVTDDGTVRVTVPRWGSKREAAAFADREREWIETERRRVEQERGRRAGCRPHGDPQIENALRERARRELPVRLLELAAEHGLAVARVTVRNQRWRWGSCSRAGHICLNWRLVAMPPAVRDYVMIHELMHLKRMDHSPKFWKLVAAACPDYHAHRVWLRKESRQVLPTQSRN